jgi:hypothetical protein
VFSPPETCPSPGVWEYRLIVVCSPPLSPLARRPFLFGQGHRRLFSSSVGYSRRRFKSLAVPTATIWTSTPITPSLPLPLPLQPQRPPRRPRQATNCRLHQDARRSRSQASSPPVKPPIRVIRRSSRSSVGQLSVGHYQGHQVIRRSFGHSPRHPFQSVDPFFGLFSVGRSVLRPSAGRPWLIVVCVFLGIDSQLDLSKGT